MTQQYVVLHFKGDMCGISVQGEGATYPYPIETWALRDGKQVRFARMQMASLLKQYHVSGRFETMALYALPPDEMLALLREQLGDTDRERWMFAQASESSHLAGSHIEMRDATPWMFGALRVGWTIAWRCFRFLLIMVVVAITLGKIGRRH